MILTPRLTPRLLLSLLLASSTCHADEPAMLRALNSWQRAQSDYRAALQRAAEDPELRAELLRMPPSPRNIAKPLWQSISKRTGSRLITPPKSSKRPPYRVPTYEYEAEWAAPAVIWWLQHSDLLTQVIASKDIERTLQSLLSTAERLHYAHPDMAELCPVLAHSASARSYDLLEKIFKKNPSATARASAALAMSLLLRHENLSSIEGDPEKVRGKRIAYIRYALQHAPRNCSFGTDPLEVIAAEEIYRLVHLNPNSVPPQIFPTAADGTTRALPIVGEPQLFYFWDPNDPASTALLRTAAPLRRQYPYLKFRAITAGITHEDIRSNPEMAQPDVEHYLDSEGKAIHAYRIPKAGFALLIDERARLLYIGEPNLQLQAAINAYDTQRQKAAQATPPAQRPDIPSTQHQDAPPLRELPPMNF